MRRSAFHIAKQYFISGGYFTNAARDLFHFHQGEALYIIRSQNGISPTRSVVYHQAAENARRRVMIYNNGEAVVGDIHALRRDDIPSLRLGYKNPFAMRTDFLAGVAGFEPANNGVKDRCLTAWRYPFIQKSQTPICV